MSVITPGPCGKFLGSSVDFPSIEVYLKRVLFVQTRYIQGPTCQYYKSSAFSFRFLRLVGGMRRNRYPRRRSGEAPWLTFVFWIVGFCWRSKGRFVLAFVSGFIRSTSASYFSFLVIFSSPSSLTLFNEADHGRSMPSVSMSLSRCNNCVLLLLMVFEELSHSPLLLILLRQL